MSKITFYFLLLVSCICFGQQFEHVDSKVVQYPDFTKLEQLSYRIQNDFDSDIDRVRAAFVWLTQNITYGKTMDELFRPRKTIIYYSERGKQKQLKKALNLQMNQAFANKRGVCFDYSMLLDELCSLFELESHIIKGIVKDEIRELKGETLYKNHTWNTVKIENEWVLMDATWAAVNWSGIPGGFALEINEHYFDSNPKEFIKDHFPAESKWQLLDTKSTLEEFYISPMFLPGYFTSNVVLQDNFAGMLSQSDSQAIEFVFEQFPIASQLNYSIDTKGNKGKIRKLNVSQINRRVFTSTLAITEAITSGENITLYLDKNPILRFRLKK